MDIETVVEILKNNRTLWVTATITGCFAIITSVINTIWLLFQRKKQLGYDMILERYKRGLDKKNYVGKVRFDTEFELYKKLSQAFFEMLFNIAAITPIAISFHTESEDRNEDCKNAQNSIVKAQNLLFENAPFIPRNFYDKYEELINLSKTQLWLFKRVGDIHLVKSFEVKKTLSNEDYIRTKEIKDKLQSLNEQIHEYLKTLEVIE